MIHQYKLGGYNIVLDVFSGSVHCVDDLAYDAIEMYETNSSDEILDILGNKYSDVSKEDILDTLSDIEELKAEGKLFTKDEYADKAFDFKNRHTQVKALCLHVAHVCNLNCEYCFASQGKYHGEKAIMSLETGEVITPGELARARAILNFVSTYRMVEINPE